MIMLKEQLFGFAMKTLSQAYDAKERIKNSIKDGTIHSYVQSIKNAAFLALENQWQKFGYLKHAQGVMGTDKSHSMPKKASPKPPQKGVKTELKERSSSIKPAKEISSKRADIVLNKLKADAARLVKKSDVIEGKKSLAYLVWALGHAERADLVEGISIHDVSALLYRACNIELYPINISRVIFGNAVLVRQISQEKRRKTYLLTPEGHALFKERFLETV
jgi:hypothetical protein